MPHRGMDPEVSDGWLKLMECELMDAVKLVVKELKGKIGENLMDCLTQLLGKMMLRKLRKNW